MLLVLLLLDTCAGAGAGACERDEDDAGDDSCFCSGAIGGDVAVVDGLSGTGGGAGFLTFDGL